VNPLEPGRPPCSKQRNGTAFIRKPRLCDASLRLGRLCVRILLHLVMAKTTEQDELHAPSESDRATFKRETSPPVPNLKQFWLFSCLAAVAILVAYSNHFHNSFHFDDSHAVIDNVYIRDLHNIPRFFTDATTFSSLPANQTWRPIVSLSLALDYRVGGLQPFWFHVSTFFWFLVQLVLMFLLYCSVLDAVAPSPVNRYISLLTVTWYGLHPAIA
jgi:hypothetical protein